MWRALCFLIIGLTFYIPMAQAVVEDDRSWGQVKNQVQDEPQAAKLTVSSSSVAGTKEVVVRVGDVVANQGEVIEVQIEIDWVNGRQINGWDVWVDYNPLELAPKGMANDEQYYGIRYVFLSADNPFENPEQTGSVWKVAMADAVGFSSDGPIFGLNFEVFGSGRLDLRIVKAQVYDQNGKAYSVAVRHGSVTVHGILRGDANGDGVVNITDALVIASHVQGVVEITDPDRIAAADYDQDGVVDMADAESVQHVDLGQ